MELSYRLSKNKLKCLPKLRSTKRNFVFNKTSFFKFGLIEIPLKTGPIVSYIYIYDVKIINLCPNLMNWSRVLNTPKPGFN